MADSMMVQRACGVALGAAIGDALGMPLEFGVRRPLDRLVRDLKSGRLPPGTFTDDTEMALALIDSLVEKKHLDADDLAARFADWYRRGPDDIGNQTGAVLGRIAQGMPWEEAVGEVQSKQPNSAGNGSVMRCWPAALAAWRNPQRVKADSLLQSRITHPHPDCLAGSVLINIWIAFLLQGKELRRAYDLAVFEASPSPRLRQMLWSAPSRRREELENSGWVCHTLESAVWGIFNTKSFEEAVIQVANLGGDADTAACVTGAVAGAYYGESCIPANWQSALRGEWPLGSGKIIQAADLRRLALQLAGL